MSEVTVLFGKAAIVLGLMAAPLIWLAARLLWRAWNGREVVRVTTHERRKFLK